MKTALIITTVSGFLLKFEKNNVRLLQELGYSVHYAANLNEPHYLYDPQELSDLGVTAHHIDIAKSPFMVATNLSALKTVVRLINELDVELIHCHTPVGGLIGRLAAPLSRKKNLRVIYTAHGFHFYQGASLVHNQIYRSIESFLARFTDALILINAEDYQSAQSFRLKPGGNVYQIPGVGLDLTRFHPVSSAEKARLRQKYGFSDDVFLMLSVGELNENKNQLVILDVLTQMLKHVPDPDLVHYAICGDGFFRDKIKEQICQKGLERHATMYGYCVDVRDYVAMADVVVFPSRREGLGMAALEALAMGVPVVASDNRGSREYMQPGINGYICSCDDVEAYVRSIYRIFQMSPTERGAMGAAARASVERFGISHTHTIMQNIYQEITRKVNR